MKDNSGSFNSVPFLCGVFLCGVLAGIILEGLIIILGIRYGGTDVLKKIETVTEIKMVEKQFLPKKRTFETILFLQPHLDPFIAKPIADAVEESCSKYNIPTSFVLSLIRHESEFDSLAVSKAGAIGLMQIMPKWHPEKVDRDLFIIKNNVDIGCQILSEYLKANDWDIYKTLNSYLGKGAKKNHVKDYSLKILKTNLDIAFFLQTLPTEYKEREDGKMEGNSETQTPLYRR